MLTQDKLWKAIFEDFLEESVAYFLPELFPKINWKRQPEILDKELAQISPDSTDDQHRRVDILVKCWLKNGKEQWILFHFEIQGYKDKHFGRRMFVYFYRLIDRYDVPIATFALLTDSDKNWKPEFYNYDFQGTKCAHVFPYLKLAEKTEKDFEGQTNPWAILLKNALFGLKKNWSDESLLKVKVNTYREMRNLGYSRQKVKSFFNFVKFYVKFEKPEFYDNFDREIHIFEQKEPQPMGIVELVNKYYEEEGLKKGMEKGMEIGIEKGIEKGIDLGIEKGIDLGVEFSIEKMLKKGLEPQFIAETLEVELVLVLKIFDKIQTRQN